MAFLGIEEVDEFADGGSKTLDGALGGFAQERFPFGEGVLDGMEVGLWADYGPLGSIG